MDPGAAGQDHVDRERQEDTYEDQVSVIPVHLMNSPIVTFVFHCLRFVLCTIISSD